MKKLSKKKLYLISPREPSGVTWLINCLLVLGIKTYRSTVDDDMWAKERTGWMLNPEEEALKKWLPVLSEVRHFTFRDDIEVEWAHFWPSPRTSDAKIIYFVRDPRDALLSRYRRESPDATFRQFLDFPDEFTQLDKVETWNLFNETWIEHPDLTICRFEDYKKSAFRTLQSALNFAGVFVSESEVQGAVDRSNFGRATAAEKRYRELHPEDLQVINRASEIGSWMHPSVSADAVNIADRCAGLMVRFNYAEGGEQSKGLSYRPHSQLLRFYHNLIVPSGFWDRPDDGNEFCRVATTVSFLSKMNVAQLNKHRLTPQQRWQLINGMREFILEFSNRTRRELSQIQALSGATIENTSRISIFFDGRGIWVPKKLRVFALKLIRFCRAAAAFRVS